MSDLILNIDLNKSRKKKHIVLETFQGKIPNLKSKQFSGQLRKVNLENEKFENLSNNQLNRIKKFLCDERNQQINGYMYLIDGNLFDDFQWIKEYGCLFYRNNERKMYNILEFSSSLTEKVSYTIEDNYMYAYDETFMCLCNVEGKEYKNDKEKITPIFYMDVLGDEISAYLNFDYSNHIIYYNQKDRFLPKVERFRDYVFEENVVSVIKKSGWNLKRDGKFIFIKKDIYYSLNNLFNANIKVFTNTGKKVSTSEFENISISYEMDWFDIDADIRVENQIHNMRDILSLFNKKTKWLEIDNNYVFLKRKELDILGKINKKNKRIGLKKEQFVDAFYIADSKKINIRNVNKLFDNNEDINIDPKVLENLREYQLDGVKWICNRCNNGFGVCLADDMGLGKTLQVIAYLSQKSLRNKVNIVIVPMILIENWKREIEKFCPDLKIKIYHGVNRNLDGINKYNILLTTYGTCLNDIKYISKISFASLVIDEAHYIKNYKSKTYKSIKMIKASSRILLTGTPMENNLIEYWGLMKMLNPDYIPSYLILNDMQESKEKTVKLMKKITSPFILRRMKKDVLKELPDRIEQTIYCEFDKKQRQIYDEVLNSVREYINNENSKYIIKQPAKYILEGILRLRQICCHPRLLPPEFNVDSKIKSSKTELALNILEKLISNGHKVVLYSDFPRVLKILKNYIEKMNIKCFYIDGGTSNKQRIVDEFEKSKESVFLISLKAGGVGLNLVSSDTVIIYNPWWNPAAEKQAEDRIYRIGQEKTVTIYKLIMTNSIEEKMQELKNRKMDISNELLMGSLGENDLTIDELKKIILYR